MSGHEPIGYLASVLVLLTFCMRDMLALRAVAIASNVAFITYGALAGIHPVLMLHITLLPMNLYRLREALQPAPLPSASAKHPSATPAEGSAP